MLPYGPAFAAAIKIFCSARNRAMELRRRFGYRPPMTDAKPDPALYRPCVGCMMVNASGLVFVGKRMDGADADFWQMPQGGVDPGENLEQAALRELEEETGVTPCHLSIIGRLERELFYDLPPELKGKLWKGRYVGQRQSWFLVRFTGQDSDIDIASHEHPEFCAWKWVEPETLPALVIPFKRPVYEAVLAGFRALI